MPVRPPVQPKTASPYAEEGNREIISNVAGLVTLSASNVFMYA
jgi:hypothetical protein